MRDSAQNMDRKSNLKSVIKAQTSFHELVHMTEKKNIFVENFLKQRTHTAATAETSGPKKKKKKYIFIFWGIITAYTVHLYLQQIQKNL